MKIQKGNVIVGPKQAAESLYLIKSGRVKIVTDYRGEYSILESLGATEMFAETSIVSGKNVIGYAIAFEDTEVVEVSKSDIDYTFSKCSPWVKTLFETLTERISNTYELIEEHHLWDDLGLEPVMPEDISFIKASIANYKNLK